MAATVHTNQKYQNRQGEIDRLKYFIVAATVVFLGTTLSFADAATYYVSKEGSDANSCSQAQNQSAAKNTVSGGINCLSGGDTLIVKGGTYAERLELKTIANGSDSAYTIIKAADGEEVWLRPTSNHSSGSYPILMIGNRNSPRHHIEIEKIGIDGSGYAGNCTAIFCGFHGMRLGDMAEETHHLIIDGIEMKNINSTNSDGIVIQNGVYGVVIRNSYFHNIKDDNLKINPNCSIYVHGSIHDGKAPNIIENNRFEDVDNGVNVRSCGSSGCSDPINDVIVRGNTFINLQTAVANSNGDRDVLIYNNIIANASGEAFGLVSYDGIPLQIYNNTVYNTPSGIRFKRGSVVGTAQAPFVKNNIFYQAGGSIPSGNFTGNPQFVNASAGDFRLSSGSPARDAASCLSEVTTDILGTPRPQGSACDYGAYEYTAGGTLPKQCADGADNDGDSLIDYPADPGCNSATDDDESDPLPPPPGGALQVFSVRASSDDGNVPENTLDNDLNTRWSALGDGQWIEYDLGSAQTMDRLAIAWYRGNERISFFDIQTSNDQTNWSTVLSTQSSGTTLSQESVDIPDTTARYLRIVGHGSSSGTEWNSITEVDIFGVSESVPSAPRGLRLR